MATDLDGLYYVSGYAGPKHRAVLSGHMHLGELLLTTWNRGSSKDTEVAAWKSRLEDGSASKVEVWLDGRCVETYS